MFILKSISVAILHQLHKKSNSRTKTPLIFTQLLLVASTFWLITSCNVEAKNLIQKPYTVSEASISGKAKILSKQVKYAIFCLKSKKRLEKCTQWCRKNPRECISQGLDDLGKFIDPYDEVHTNITDFLRDISKKMDVLLKRQDTLEKDRVQNKTSCSQVQLRNHPRKLRRRRTKTKWKSHPKRKYKKLRRKKRRMKRSKDVRIKKPKRQRKKHKKLNAPKRKFIPKKKSRKNKATWDISGNVIFTK